MSFLTRTCPHAMLKIAARESPIAFKKDKKFQGVKEK